MANLEYFFTSSRGSKQITREKLLSSAVRIIRKYRARVSRVILPDCISIDVFVIYLVAPWLPAFPRIHDYSPFLTLPEVTTSKRIIIPI